MSWLKEVQVNKQGGVHVMKAPDIVDYGLDFSYVYERDATDLIVIHHTGNPSDDDLSAEQIHASHLAQGWSGIGYHYVVRKNGQVEQGRPEWAVGAHAQGANWDSIGVHVCGNFEQAYPTGYQIESLAYLIGWLCEKYGLETDAYHIKGHRDLMATACPGAHLYEILRTIRGKAAWYRENYRGGD